LTSLALLPIFLIGLFGGVHCVGMCGGIVGAFSIATPARRPFPVPVATQSGLLSATADGSLRVLAFNAGRIGSYMIAGALAGGLVGSVATLTQMTSLQTMGYWAANLMLIALGASMMQLWHGLAHLESVGQLLWRRLQPLIKHLLPVETIVQAAALGGLWGWVPCGMVYSVLMTAMLTGSARDGALVMGAFGLGTLPLLVSMGLLGSSLQPFLRKPPVRLLAGALVLAFGLLGLIRAATGISHGWLDAVCITPAAMR
jgi:sulfite exporter TauE/SafE